MRPFLKIFVLIFLLNSYLYSATTNELLIFHTGDTHSHIEPYGDGVVLPYHDQLSSTKNETNIDASGMGGLVKIATYIKENKIKDSLVIDSGDLFQGTAYYNLFKGEVEVSIFNSIGYDYITLGNHEYDSGINALVRAIKKAKFKIIVSNYDFGKTELKDIVKPYDIIIRNGIKIGIIGLSPNVTSRREVYSEGKIIFKNPIKSAKKMAKFLKKKMGVDLVICITHLGYSGEKKYPGDVDLIKKVAAIDLILGGHSHTIMKKPEIHKGKNGNITAIDHSGFYSLYVSKLTLTMRDKKLIGVR